jgi:hypothetical protein
MRLRRNGLPCDVVQRTSARAERKGQRRRHSLTVPLFSPTSKQRENTRARQARDFETGKRASNKVRSTDYSDAARQNAECRVGQQSRAEEEAGETTNKKSPDADSDDFLSPWSLAAAPGGRQRPEGQ